MDRRDTLLALVALGASPLASRAQAPGRIRRIGFLGAFSAQAFEPQIAELRKALRELGHVEGTNLVIQYRWAEGKYDLLPGLAGELLRMNSEVLVTHGTPGIRAAKQVTTTVPIVMATSGDAVATGLVQSLARPGGNVTGISFSAPDLASKRVELLKAAVPGLRSVALLTNPDNPRRDHVVQATANTAKSLNIKLQSFSVRTLEDLEGTFAAISKQRLGGIALTEDAVLIANAPRIAELAIRHRLPSIGFSNFAENGGLITYGVNILTMFRRSAYFVDRILKGARPEDLPVEQPERFELVINLKSAKAVGVAVPKSVLLRADKLME
jgi:putative ABC transport system substrate-binding protein